MKFTIYIYAKNKEDTIYEEVKNKKDEWTEVSVVTPLQNRKKDKEKTTA